MAGTTAMMASAMDPALSRRSYSTPNLLSATPFDTEPSLSDSMSHLLESSKTSTVITSFEIPSFDTDFSLDTTLFLKSPSTNNVTAAAKPTPQPPQPLMRASTESPSSSFARTRSATVIADRPLSWFPGVKARDERRPVTSAKEKESEPTDGHPAISDLQPLERSQTTSESFASFAKRSWMSSRSPSPKSRPDSPVEKAGDEGMAMHGRSKRASTPKRLEITTNGSERSHSSDSNRSSKAFARASNYFSKIKQKPTNTLTKNSNGIGANLSGASSVASLAPPTSSTFDTNGASSTYSDTNVTTPTTDTSSIEMPPRQVDPLWSSFKTLEMEFKGFAAKPMAQKTGQIQTLLLPFLKSSNNQASIRHLKPEDVDRRATILNKWWSGILDILEGQYQQPVPGVDRPILLEAATMVMMRPEWRQTTSYFLPLSERSPMERVRSRSWTNASDSSRTSSQSAMIAESAEHNVRTMFVSNLVKQMAFVVEKMSLRHAPLSLVNFAGKTCAYAFFFAPGVPDILVRLWGLTPDLIRRTADELKLPRKESGESDDIIALFPPKLSTFGWSSPRNVWDNLKHIPKMPMLVARIPWTGPWVSRWKGNDTDLFFIFCKYFHVLSDQFMPSQLPLIEKARSPAFALVHAQLLSIIDSTIHRQAAVEAAYGYGQSLTDSMQGPDAAAHAMPLPPTNLMKGMAENRLVVLLKDILSDEDPKFEGARHTFAEAFAAMMKGATCRTSRFNSNACFTLCDFLEEALMIYNQFETGDKPVSYIDWSFWFDVCKKVLTSLNTMSEVRMLSFIFTIWDAIAKDPRRKRHLCHDWLLTEETFNALFNNWCPMVRAYYQRLLCWRICRDKGSPNEIDLENFLLVAERLRTVWSHYLYLKQDAEESGRVLPSSAPMSPALGKKFIIIRQEVNAPQPGLLVGFDSFAKLSNTDLIPGDGSSDSNAMAKSDNKKRWSLLGRVLSLGSGGASTLSGSVGRHSMEDELQTARREMAESRARAAGPTPPPKSTKSSDSGRSSPIFDEQKFVFKFVLGWQQPPMPSRDRVLVRPRLPTPAHARVNARSRSGSPPPPPASLPAAERTVSGSSQVGLVDAARNASSFHAPNLDAESRRRSSSLSFSRGGPFAGASPPHNSSGTSTPNDSRVQSFTSFSTASQIQFDNSQVVESVTQPLKPAGIYARTAVYSGRSLAEWSLVVAECNNFVERRRDEGVLGLREVEVPTLSVEGFRKAGGN